jgi:hypothetical protein
MLLRTTAGPRQSIQVSPWLLLQEIQVRPLGDEAAIIDKDYRLIVIQTVKVTFEAL